MVQQTDTGWLTVLEKNGLRLVTDIFENYGIDSETDLSVIDQDDFSKLYVDLIIRIKTFRLVF